MDNQASESSSENSSTALNVDGGAQAFAAFLDPQEAPGKSAQELEKEALEDVTKQPNQQQEQDLELQQAELDAGQETVTIKVDGKDVTLSTAELADAYKNGLRQADYTRKTMEAAEQRKAADAQIQQAQQERQAYANNLQKMAAQLEEVLQEQQGIDWSELLENDPRQYLMQKDLFEKRQLAYQKNIQQQQHIAALNQQEQAEHLARHLSDQQAELLAKVPDWKDPKKAEAESTAISRYLAEQGFDKNTVDSVTDAKTILISRKAMLYDAMMAKANAAAKKVAEVPQKVIRPGVSGNNQDSDKDAAQMRKLAKSGRVEDAASLFAKFI